MIIRLLRYARFTSGMIDSGFETRRTLRMLANVREAETVFGKLETADV